VVRAILVQAAQGFAHSKETYLRALYFVTTQESSRTCNYLPLLLLWAV